MRIPILLAALLPFAPGAAAAQTSGDYLQLKDRYATAPMDAVRELAAWPHRTVNEGVDLCLQVISGATGASLCTRQDRMAAAMMHTDLAVLLLIDGDRAHAILHTAAASRFIARLRDEPEFATRWYAFTAQLYFSRGLREDADDVLAAGRQQYAESPTIQFAAGALIEGAVMADHGNARGELDVADRDRAFPRLDQAAAAYLRTLELDPDNVAARLRLGWVRLLTCDGRAAGDLQAALRTADDDRTRALHARARRDAGALPAHVLPRPRTVAGLARDPDAAAQGARRRHRAPRLPRHTRGSLTRQPEGAGFRRT